MVGYAINRHEGLPFRHYQRLNADSSSIVLGGDRSLLKHACGMPKNIASQFEWCLSQDKTTPPSFAVIGDSKGEALYYGLARESRQDENWMMLGSFQTFKLQKNDDQNLLAQSLTHLERNTNIKTIVFANTYRHLFPTSGPNGFISKSYSSTEIENAVNEQNEVIKRLQFYGKKIVFLVDNPTLPDPRDCIEGTMTSIPILDRMLYRTANAGCSLSYKKHVQGTVAYQEFITSLAIRNPQLLIFNPTYLLCDIAIDICTYHKEKKFLYSYGDHISDYANSLIAKELLPLIRSQ
jgi:hypothetical protein